MMELALLTYARPLVLSKVLRRVSVKIETRVTRAQHYEFMIIIHSLIHS